MFRDLPEYRDWYVRFQGVEGGPWSARGRILSALMVPGAFRSVFTVSGGCFISFTSVPGGSGMVYI